MKDGASVPDTSRRLNAVARMTHSVVSDSLLRKGFLSLLDQAIVSGTSFLTVVLVGRTCSKSELGVYYLALTIVFFIRGIQEQVVSAPYMIYCNHRKGEELSTYGGSSLAHQFALSLITIVALATFAGGLLATDGPATLTSAVTVLLWAAPFMLLREFVRQFLYARFQLRAAIAIDVAVAILQIGGLAWLAGSGKLTVPLVYVVIGAACTFASLVWFLAVRKPLRFLPSRFATDWWHNWRFARWALACHLVGCTSVYILPWILAVARDEAETGVLAAGASLVGFANMLVVGLANFLCPKAANAYAEGGVRELRPVLRKAAIVFVVILGVFCVAVVLSGDELAQLVYGPKYAGSGAVVAILAFGMLANSLSVTAGNGLWAMMLPSANFRADVTALLATTVAAVLLIPPAGAIGAATATLIGAVAGAIVRFLILRSRMAADPDPGP